MDNGIRIDITNNTITKMYEFDPLTGEIVRPLSKSIIYPAKHYMTDPATYEEAFKKIHADLDVQVTKLKAEGKIVEAQRISQRTNYDLEMIKEVGYVNGIENYSIYFDGRKPGDPPYSLVDYFPFKGKDWLLIIDESHITLPQIRGMYNGDRARKQTLIDYGFRLPSALDNRPLKFDEFMRKTNQRVYVSATPDEYEISLSQESETGIVEQLIRPTGLVDPVITVKPTAGQIQDLIEEIEKRVKKKERVLVTTLTKRMSEELTSYLEERDMKVAYLHSDIITLDRQDILDRLRSGEYDVLVGINLLREGLDLPEVSLVIILDADKEGFLRSRTSLIQTMGRAARHVDSQVIMYADVVTQSMKAAISEIDRRRTYQEEYNKNHGITPESIQKAIRERIVEKVENPADLIDADHKKDEIFNYDFLDGISPNSLTPYDRAKLVKKLEREMKRRAEMMDFEAAIAIRDKVKVLKN
jgi:excinuclease ABC subunit B